MDGYLKSSALLATSQTMSLAATVLGFDIVELWNGNDNSCTYVHASERILQAYDVSTGLYPSDRVHVLSPRLCDIARESPNGYHWHVIEDGEEKINCFGQQAQTEVAFMLKGEDGQFDVFLVGFSMTRLNFTLSKAKFLSGLCYAIMVAAYDMDDDEENAVVDPSLDIQADIARQRLRYISTKLVHANHHSNSNSDSNSNKEKTRSQAVTPSSRSGGSDDDNSSNNNELQFQIDENISVVYISLDKIPLLLTTNNNMELSDFSDIVHLADGSNANIYSAVYNHRRVVLKMIKKDMMSDEIAVLEFDTEAGLLARVQHPHIVQLIGRGKHPRKFLVLEHLSGGSITSTQNLIQSTHGISGLSKSLLRKPSYTYDALLSLIRDIAEALNYLHTRYQGVVIIHRDIKPDNLGFAEGGVVKLFDFGLSAVVRRTKTSAEAFEMTGNTGSLRYMAPEVVLSKPYNEKVDVYSFGIMVWQMATDRIPFKGMSREQFMKEVVLGKQRPKLDSSWPVGFKALLESCWHDEYQKRPSFAFLLDDIKTLIRNLKWEASIPKLSSNTGDYII